LRIKTYDLDAIWKRDKIDLSVIPRGELMEICCKRCPLQMSIEKKRKKEKSFQEELAELSTVDPDFYDYLKREEADILDEDEREDSERNG